MFWRRNLLVGVIFVGLLASPGHASDFGRTASPEEIKLWDIDVRRNWQPIAPSSTARFRRGPSTATTGRELKPRKPSSQTGGARA
jgi:hypothetical protein